MGQRTSNKLQNPLGNVTLFWDHLIKMIQKCIAVSNQSAGLPEMGILLHFTSSPHVSTERLHCWCLYATVISSPWSPSSLGLSDWTDPCFWLPACTGITPLSCLPQGQWAQCDCSVVLSPALMASEHLLCLFSPPSAHIRLITHPVSCAVPNALQKEQSSIPNHSLLLKIDGCHWTRHFPLVIFCTLARARNFLWNGNLYPEASWFPAWQFSMKNAHCSQQILILTMF